MRENSLPTESMRRLAFIRALYQQGVEQSGQLEPWTAASVLSFHDAVELFMILSAEHLNTR
jgi:hypothetical protein